MAQKLEGVGAERMPKNVLGLEFYLRCDDIWLGADLDDIAKQIKKKGIARLKLDEFFWENRGQGKDQVTIYLRVA